MSVLKFLISVNPLARYYTLKSVIMYVRRERVVKHFPDAARNVAAQMMLCDTGNVTF